MHRRSSFINRLLVVLAAAPTLAAPLFAPRGARAEGDEASTEPVRVQFDGPEGCPDGTRFLDEVRARTRLVRLAADDEPARLFRVEVARAGGLTRGTLIIEEIDHKSTPRRVVGASCEDVVGALALVAALAVDPLATILPIRLTLNGAAGLPTGTISIVPPPVPPVSATPRAPPASGTAHVARTTDRPPPAPSPADARRPPRPGLGWQAAAGALFDVVGAAAPGAVIGVNAFVEFERNGEALLTPTLRAGVAGFGGRAIPAGPGDGRFTWWVGQLDACPMRLRIADGVFAKPCAAAEFGILAANGAGVLDAHSELRPWVSVGALARLEWRLSRLFVLDAYGGLRVPITRENFVFQPGLPIYTAPREMLAGGGGLKALFP